MSFIGSGYGDDSTGLPIRLDSRKRRKRLPMTDKIISAFPLKTQVCGRAVLMEFVGKLACREDDKTGV